MTEKIVIQERSFFFFSAKRTKKYPKKNKDENKYISVIFKLLVILKNFVLMSK